MHVLGGRYRLSERAIYSLICRPTYTNERKSVVKEGENGRRAVDVEGDRGECVTFTENGIMRSK